ncbi:MAG TPA: rhomboid family intramembrane serine protease [Sedimenticola sp.]|nr:rhomboid family intramembrane serine protease [Sedimenticola sp.]
MNPVDGYGGQRPSPRLLPPVVAGLLIANGVMFLLQGSLDDLLTRYLALWPFSDTRGSLFAAGGHALFHPWQLVTYAFLHAGVLHLLLNMYALWMFGIRLENLWGSRAFLLYYFVCVVGAATVQLLVSSFNGEIYPTIGASGGVFGVLLAFGMNFPNERLLLLFPPVILKAKWFVVLFGAIELWFGVTGTAPGIAHFAHLGGMLFGYLLLLHWRHSPPGHE